MDIEKLIDRLRNNNIENNCHGCALGYYAFEAATALSTLQVENEKLRAELEQERAHRIHAEQHADAFLRDCERINAQLERVTAERDVAVEAVQNMAEYIVCAGRVDYFLCDEISQEHHLKYQPKNDGNYDNEPCYKCVADWFLQGHKWQGSNW